MSYKKYEIIHQTAWSTNPFFLSPPFPSFFPSDDLTITPLDVITPPVFDPFLMDLIQIEETTPFYKRVVKTTQTRKPTPTELYLRSISDRVCSLESRFDRLLALKEKENEKEKEKEKKKKLKEVDRKYTWTAEIKGGEERKYTWKAEIEGKKGERKYEWSSEVKGKGGDDDVKKYTWKATIGGDKKKGKKEKKKTEGGSGARIVEIEDDEPVFDHHRALVLRQAFAKRPAKNKGKKKELSPLDAVVLIQKTFRAYLIRRSQALRALRELAIAKSKLKELRASFHNFTFRSCISRDAEQRQKFSEKIIVLLLTVDAIQGVDMMVRAAKRSMVDELEAMLDVVDPQQPGRSLSMRRRTFDMPSGAIQKEIAEGVAQVVQMLDEEHATFEACV
ncbi:hypothetical protein KSS87_014632 [Heliosperma pusillum]|nr:hypothetical protein KSS87_014632 [Heliosperma pusillum]